MDNKPLYFDDMATTPVDPQVIETMLPFLGPRQTFGNPASTHSYGIAAARAIAHAQEQVARAIGVSEEALVWTSGATEANNLALFGAARFYQRKGRHIISMSTEHRSVLDPLAQLAREGFEVTYLAPQSDGLLDLAVLEAALREDTILVSIMHVNNETGVIQPLDAIQTCLQRKGILLHVDAAQSVGKVSLNLQTMHVDLLSLSAHKCYGPKGVGALYVRQRPRVRLQPQIWGGGQQNGLRSGTLPTHQLVGMGMAVAIAAEQCEQEQARLLNLRTQLWQGLSDLPGVFINGSLTARVANNLNVCFSQFKGQHLMTALAGIAASNASACAALSGHPSYVLRAMGLTPTEAQHSIRFSLGRYTTEDDVKQAIHIIRGALK